MFGLLYKDFIVRKKTWIASSLFISLGTLIYVILMAFSLDIGMKQNAGDVQFFSMTIATIYIMDFFWADTLSGNLFRYDESKKWASFAISTPKGAEGQIKSKYIGTLILFYMVGSLSYIIDMIAGIITGFGAISVTVISAFFFFEVLMKAIEIPFIVYFGQKNGNNVKFLIILAIGFAVGVYFLFGDISMFGSMEDFMDWLYNIISGKTGGKIITILSAVTPFATFALYYLSYRISCRLYTKGVMNYDK